MLKYSQILRDNDKVNFSVDELAYIYPIDKDGIRSYLTYEGYQGKLEPVFEKIKHRKSVYLEYDSSTKKWNPTPKTTSGFWDEKVLSEAQLLLTFDNQTTVNFNEILETVSNIAFVGVLILSAGELAFMLDYGEKYGVDITEEVIFKVTPNVISELERLELASEENIIRASILLQAGVSEANVINVIKNNLASSINIYSKAMYSKCYQ